MESKPRITVEAFRRDGNAFALLAAVRRAYRRAGRAADFEAIREDAMSGDYSHLVATLSAAVTFDDADGEAENE